MDKIRTFISPPITGTGTGGRDHDDSRDRLSSFIGTALEADYWVEDDENGRHINRDGGVNRDESKNKPKTRSDTKPVAAQGRKSRSSTFRINMKLNQSNPNSNLDPNPPMDTSVATPISIASMLKGTQISSESPSELINHHQTISENFDEDISGSEEDSEEDFQEENEDDDDDEDDGDDISEDEFDDISGGSDEGPVEASTVNPKHRSCQHNLHRILGPFEVLMHQAELCFDPELRLSHGLSIPASDQYFCYLALRVSYLVIYYPLYTLL